jgi:cobalamin synthase
MYKLSSSYAASGGAPVDLSDATISRLSAKLAAMRDLKVGLLTLQSWVLLAAAQQLHASALHLHWVFRVSQARILGRT